MTDTASPRITQKANAGPQTDLKERVRKPVDTHTSHTTSHDAAGVGISRAEMEGKLNTLRDDVLSISEANLGDLADGVREKTDSLILASESACLSIASLEQCVDMTETNVRNLEVRCAALQEAFDVHTETSKRKFAEYEGEMHILMAKLDAVAAEASAIDIGVIPTGARNANYDTTQVDILTSVGRRIKISYPGNSELRVKT